MLNKVVEAFNSTLAEEAERNAEAARAQEAAVSGQRMSIRMGWIVGGVTAAVNVVIGLLRVFW